MSKTVSRSSFLDKILGRIDHLDEAGLQVALQRLARERGFLETLFNTIEDGILVIDKAGALQYYNNAATKLLGLPDNDALGEKAHRYLPGIDWSRIRDFDLAEGKKTLRYEFEIEYPNKKFIRLYAAPLNGGEHGMDGAALILHDATEVRDETEKAIETERNQALTLLAASVAHEIGNPLNALHIHLQLLDRDLRKLKEEVKGFAQPDVPISLEPLKRKRGRPRKQPGNIGAASAHVPQEAVDQALESAGKLQNYVEVAKDEILRLDYIVTQFLQAVRPSPLKLEPCSLNDIIVDTLALLQPEIQNRDLLVRRRFLPGLPKAPMDPEQIRRLLINLIKNALQSMTTGGMLTLNTGVTDDEIWFSVTDTGSGIAPNKISSIFEPLQTTKSTGTGLGLMIVHRIVSAHRGRIHVESSEGKGSTFRVYLPLREPQARLLGQG